MVVLFLLFSRLILLIANVMNFITSQRAISMFPRTTFISMKYIRSAQEEIISNGDIHIRPLLRNTGWYDLLDDDEVRGTELTVARRAGDPLCWTIPNDVSREIFTGAPFNYFVLFAGNTYSPPDIKNAPSNRDHGCTSFGRIKLDNCSHQCEWFP